MIKQPQKKEKNKTKQTKFENQIPKQNSKTIPSFAIFGARLIVSHYKTNKNPKYTY